MKKPPKCQRKSQRSRKRPAAMRALSGSSVAARHVSHVHAPEPVFAAVSRLAMPAFLRVARVTRDVRLPAPVAAALAARTPAEREAMALLAAPLFLLAFAIAYAQMLHRPHPLTDVFQSAPVVAARPYVPVFQRAISREIASSFAGEALTAEVAARDLPISIAPSLRSDRDGVHVLQPAVAAWIGTPRTLPFGQPVRTAVIDSLPRSLGSVLPPAVTALLPGRLLPSYELPRYSAGVTAEPGLVAMQAGYGENLPSAEDMSRQPARIASAGSIFATSSDGGAAWTRSCSVSSQGKQHSSLLAPVTFDAARRAQTFGLALARAARSQIGDIVIYNDRYRRISFPMGDVNSLFGVCTDVVIRAYRALGVDLQALVYQTKSGHGDTSIDHRRTEVLRRFFSLHGEALPVTDFAEDYLPGDIVTYYRPQNNHSRSHIALVSEEIGPSGRPMIIHNRGWGVQMEDALLVDRITGHYRFAGQILTPTVTGNTSLIQKASVQSQPEH